MSLPHAPSSAAPAAAAPAVPEAGARPLLPDDSHPLILAVLSELERLAERAQQDAIDADMRASARAIVDFIGHDVRDHHQDEERHVFPALTAGGDEAVVQAVLRLETDHGWLEEDWLEIEPHVQAIASGIGHCDPDALRHGVAVYSALYRDHIALEEAMIYPQARERLSLAALRSLGRERARRRHQAKAGRE